MTAADTVVGPRTAYGDWTRQAECQTLGDAADEIFFPLPGDDKPRMIALARAICADCPVQAECLAHAMALEGDRSALGRHGVYAGTTPAQRARMTAIRTTLLRGEAA